MINGKQTDRRKEMYLKYKKSTIFNDGNPGATGLITTKINKKKYNQTFEPKYNEKNAREQYIKQFWKKDPQCFPIKSTNPKTNANAKLSKSFYSKKNLNANEIMCRDMYSNCNPKEYQMRRSKSSYLKRSKECFNSITTNNTIRNSNANAKEMNSKERFVDSLQSNIFFSSERNSNANESKHSLEKIDSNNNRISIYPLGNSNGISNLKIPNSRITHSKLTSNFDWKYVNTEISSERLSLNVNKLNGNCNGNHFKKNISNENDHKRRQNLLNGHQKENFINLNSVNYDIITNTEGGIASKNGIVNKANSRPKVLNDSLIPNQQKKSIQISNGNSSSRTVNHCKETDEYQIDVPKEFDKLNIKEIKNMFYSAGIHLYKCETRANSLSNGSGKIVFKVRKDKNDCEYLTKIKTINSKIANSQMALNKTLRNTLRPM